MKDTSIIPHGSYCYSADENGKLVPCPYWSRRKDKPEQDNGFCSWMNKGDWQFEGLSLLWDQVKECGINKDYENDKNKRD